jgi:hypothetical protein
MPWRRRAEDVAQNPAVLLSWLRAMPVTELEILFATFTKPTCSAFLEKWDQHVRINLYMPTENIEIASRTKFDALNADLIPMTLSGMVERSAPAW